MAARAYLRKYWARNAKYRNAKYKKISQKRAENYFFLELPLRELYKWLVTQQSLK